MQSFSLAGKNALVIGGTSGIGFHIARGFAQAGAKVAIAGRTPAKIDPALKDIRAHDKDARGYMFDVSDADKLDALVAAVVKDYGHIDILVPAQGITIIKPAEEFTAADYDKIMNTNMRSVFMACIAVGKHMLARKSGCIINIASLAAHRGWPRAPVYAVSKHGVAGLTHSLAAEWGERGVRVNAISPGFFMTEMTMAAMPQARKEAALMRTAMNRFGDLDELVGAAIYLASPAAGFVTGSIVNVDGGYLAKGI